MKSLLYTKKPKHITCQYILTRFSVFREQHTIIHARGPSQLLLKKNPNNLTCVRTLRSKNTSKTHVFNFSYSTDFTKGCLVSHIISDMWEFSGAAPALASHLQKRLNTIYYMGENNELKGSPIFFFSSVNLNIT